MLLARADEVIELVRIEPVQVQLTTAPETSTARFRTASHRSSRPPAVCGLAQSQSTARPLCAVMMTESRTSTGCTHRDWTALCSKSMGTISVRNRSSGARAHLEKVLAKAPVGIQFNEHVEFDDVTVFEAACKMGLEGSSRSGATSPISAASLRAGSSSRTRRVRRCCG